MNECTDQQLLRDYAERRSESAFAAIVHRYADLVYSAALRMVRDPDAAQDVTQNVFAVLARNARQLTQRPALAGWLHDTARNLAVKTVRSDARRRAHEKEAVIMNQLLSAATDAPWDQIAPQLDDALIQLSERDREALLLRYFKNYDFRTVGTLLGISDDAAQKRVSRAIERLQEFLAKRGVTIGASGLVVILSTNAVQAAPAGLAATISTAAAALTGTAVSTSTAIITTKAIAMTALQKTLVTVTLALLAGAGIYEARQTSQLRDQVETLHQLQAPLAEQIQELKYERDDATNRLAGLLTENLRLKLNSNQNEVLKLRGEVGRLRTEVSQASDPIVQSALEWKARVAELKKRLAEMPEQQIPQLQLLTDEEWLQIAKHAKLDTDIGSLRALGQLRSQARGDLGGMMSMALMNYTQASNGKLPDDILQLKPYFKSSVDDAMLQQYQLLLTGKLSDVQPGQWLIAEKSPLQQGFDTTFHVGYDAFGVEQNGPLEEALGKFYEANTGQEPTDFSQLLPYVKDPAMRAALVKALQHVPGK